MLPDRYNFTMLLAFSCFLLVSYTAVVGALGDVFFKASPEESVASRKSIPMALFEKRVNENSQKNLAKVAGVNNIKGEIVEPTSSKRIGEQKIQYDFIISKLSSRSTSLIIESVENIQNNERVGLAISLNKGADWFSRKQNGFEPVTMKELVYHNEMGLQLEQISGIELESIFAEMGMPPGLETEVWIRLIRNETDSQALDPYLLLATSELR